MTIKTPRGTRDPRAYRTEHETYSFKDLVQRIDNALRVGWEEATNTSVRLNETPAGRKALRQLANGNDDAFRAYMRNAKKNLRI